MKKLTILFTMIIFTLSCNTSEEKGDKEQAFDYFVEQFADLRILRYKVPEFENLTLDQKKLVYYLSEAARCGRDILFDQNGKYNLAIRKTLEIIYETYSGERAGEDWENFMIYLKRIWFSNGIYHHYSTDKILPDFSKEYFLKLVEAIDKSALPVKKGQDIDDFISEISTVMFDKQILSKKVCQNPDMDIVTNSAVNFYENITQKEVESYYNKMKIPGDNNPISYGLNTKIAKEEGEIVENVWKLGGMYSAAIEKIIYWLDKAKEVAENDIQKKTIASLIDYYKTGDLQIFDEYSILWVKDTTSRVDFINGFIEVYSDPMGLKGTWESVVNFKDIEASKRTRTISENAQWFENHSPIDDKFKKKEVKGVTAKVITVAQLGGDCYPHTPIGINLPNADWIRKEYGSKSVTIENITYAYDQANLKTGFLEEFTSSQEEIDLIRKYGPMAGNLHTDLHECLGHGSGQLLPGIATDALKNYHSPLEETRADLFALYYMMDPKMVELELLPTLDAAKAEYIGYIRNGLMTQLTRIEFGKNIEQAHMRCRKLISTWCFEKGQDDNVIEKIVRDGKTYFKINDFEKLRSLIGELLKEVQRIKSEGDYEAGKYLVETYAVEVDPVLHKEVLDRYEKLKLAPYSGFINPDFIVEEQNGRITDIKIVYKDDYVKQMMRYSKEYSFLPVYN